MDQNRITDQELQVILDYFKQFQIRLTEMNIDDLVLKLRERELTEKEKQQIIEDFATMRHPGPDVVPVEEFKALIRKFRHEKRPVDLPPFTHDMDFTKNREEIEAIVQKLKNDDVTLTKDEVDKLVKTLLNKMFFKIMHSVHSARGASDDIWYYWIHGHWPKGRQFNEFLQDHFFEPFKCHLTPEQIDEKIAKLLELKERASVVPTDDEMFGDPKPFPKPPIVIHARDAVFSDEEIAGIIAAANMPKNAGHVLTQPEIDAIVEAMTKKLREALATGPILTQEQIDIIVGDLAGKLRNTDPVLTQPEIDAIVEAMTKKLRELLRPALNDRQIDYIIQITRDKPWALMSDSEKAEILGNIRFL